VPDSSQTVVEDLGAILARHVVTTGFDALSAAAVQAAKYSTLDTLGVIAGASGLMDVMPGIVGLARELGGKPESTLIGWGGKVPSVSAAFVNGAMGHGLDFDDHLPEGHHPSVSVVPAMFAVAERKGGVTGEAFITALALGQDIFARLRKNVTWKQDWFMTPVLGVFAATAACGKLLGLTEEQMLNAFGIASCQSATTFQIAYGTGGDLRGMYAAFAAKGGVLSALLAETGVKGTSTPFEGKAGFLEVYFGKWDREAMVADLGKDFQGSTILYKLWPSCGVTHAYIDTALRLMDGPGRGDEIRKLELYGGDFAKQLSEPAEFRRHPPTVVDAKFSIPYTVALALTKGTVALGDFSDERRNDPEIAAVAQKIEFVDDPQYNWGKALPDGAVRIHLENGETLFSEARHHDTPGAVGRPLDWPQIVSKFKDCAAYAVRPLTGEPADQVVRDVGKLETVPDVSAVIELLG
jgi:2-methylcitrate dehydratase PrpD